MQPTLFGIVGDPTDTPPPNPLIRAFEFVTLGRHYFELRSKEEDVVVTLQESTYLNFFTFTTIVCRNRSYTLFVPRDPLMRYFRVVPGREYSTGEVIARGHMDTGDQVFVDKVSYNFVKPKAGDVFVFKTTDIREIEAGLDPSMGYRWKNSTELRVSTGDEPEGWLPRLLQRWSRRAALPLSWIARCHLHRSSPQLFRLGR